MRANRILSITIFGAATLLTSCSDQCENILLNRSSHPQGNRAAVVFDRICGATTDNSVQISITDGRLPSETGNVLVADNISREFIEENPPIWTDRKNLVVFLPSNSRIFHRTEKLDGINIRFLAK